ncbi:MAG TPA: dethiobiotin synthase [Trebonia sp.]|jgi:dethiobiotin synthase
MNPLPKIVFITGTDTDVGKTITTAALAAALSAGGRSVAVYKPTQAGTVNGQGDIDVVRQLTGLDELHEGIRLGDPMAPVAAAARAAVTLPSLGDHTGTIRRLAAAHDHVLVEGAGGLLVALDECGHTLADFATAIAAACTAIVVCRSGLGTLNHTELTLEALSRRGIPVAGTVIGSWPQQPSDIDLSNRDYLGRHDVPLIGVIPAGAANLSPADFRASAGGWFRVGR